MFQIFGDNIEIDSRVVAKITIPPSTLRERAETLLEFATPDSVGQDTYKNDCEAEYDRGFTDGESGAKADLAEHIREVCANFEASEKLVEALLLGT